MKVTCIGCATEFDVSEDWGGRWGNCSQCGNRFLVPIPDPNRLLQWVYHAPWHRVDRFQRYGGAHGHTQESIDRFVEAVFRRRSAEQDRERCVDSANRISAGKTESERSERRHRNGLCRRLKRDIELAQLRKLSPLHFDQFIANLFDIQPGLRATVVAGESPGGVDVQIELENSEIWAVAKCRRLANDGRVAPTEILKFAEGFLLSGAERGFFFTTGRFSKESHETAREYPWLVTYNGHQLCKYAAAITRAYAPNSPAAHADQSPT